MIKQPLYKYINKLIKYNEENDEAPSTLYRCYDSVRYKASLLKCFKLNLNLSYKINDHIKWKLFERYMNDDKWTWK